MRSVLRIAGCMAFMALTLPLACPVFAQQPGDGASAMQQDEAQNGGCPERQELREERERIRAEHESLESEHDTVKMQCMDAKGQERSECVQKKDQIHARMDALHERMKALHDKVMAEPECHHGHKGHGDKAPWPSRQETPDSAPIPAKPSSDQ